MAAINHDDDVLICIVCQLYLPAWHAMAGMFRQSHMHGGRFCVVSVREETAIASGLKCALTPIELLCGVPEVNDAS
jgi:hypothetical protein